MFLIVTEFGLGDMSLPVYRALAKREWKERGKLDHLVLCSLTRFGITLTFWCRISDAAHTHHEPSPRSSA
jgi:hypothetical protein